MDGEERGIRRRDPQDNFREQECHTGRNATWVPNSMLHEYLCSLVTGSQVCPLDKWRALYTNKSQPSSLKKAIKKSGA